MPGVVNGNSAIVALGHWLEERFDVSCGEHPAFGGVSGSHTTNSYHYRAAALDVNHDQGDESAVLNEIYDTLADNARALGIKELFFEGRGIPVPVSNHYDHLHVAMEGPPTKALEELVIDTGDSGGFSLGDLLKPKLPGTPSGSLDSQNLSPVPGAEQLASAAIKVILDAIGADGARILLYIALVGGGTVLVYYGAARVAGMQKPIGTPASLAVAVGTKGKGPK